MIGDINCDDLSIDEKSTMIRKLQDLYRVYQTKQLIEEPTRSTLTTATIIDNFTTNKPNLIISSGVFTGFSDHDMILAFVKSPLALKENKKSSKHGS